MKPPDSASQASGSVATGRKEDGYEAQHETSR
jgi:hypothetical protein